MKTCTKCNCSKDSTEFYSKGKENRTAPWCKSCFNSYCVARWRKRKEAIVARFAGTCLDCAGTYHPSVFEFHHLDPTSKEFSWSKLRLFSDKKMDEELSKCVMLCANCHRLRHYALYG